MTNTTQTISQANFGPVMAWLEQSLSEAGLDKREILTARLLVEENFLQMNQGSRLPAEDFSAQIAIRKWFGDINIELSAPGDPHEPLSMLNVMVPDETVIASRMILKAHEKRLRFLRTNGRNIVIIRVHESENKQIRRTLAALIGGVLLGLLLKEVVTDPHQLAWIEDNYLDSIQVMFLNALISFSAPMIFFSILSGISSISDTTTLSRIGSSLTRYSLPKLAFYVALGLLVGHFLGGMNALSQTLIDDDAIQAPSNPLKNLIVSIIPGDIVTPFHTNNILQMLFLACLSGILLTRAGKWTSWARDGISFFSRFFMEIIELITPFIPLVVLVSMIKLTIHTGLDSLLRFGLVIFWTAMGLPISLLVSGALILLLGRLSPIPFIRKAAKFIPLPLSICSSTACMPSTLSFCRKELGMNEAYSKFSIPVGMQLNMDGTAYYVAIISMILAHSFGIAIDTEFCLSFFLAQLLIALTGIGLIAMPSIYTAFGIPGIAVTLVIGLEPILDMFGTAQSVIGNMTTSLLICQKENALDEEKYLGESG